MKSEAKKLETTLETYIKLSKMIRVKIEIKDYEKHIKHKLETSEYFNSSEFILKSEIFPIIDQGFRVLAKTIKEHYKYVDEYFINQEIFFFLKKELEEIRDSRKSNSE